MRKTADLQGFSLLELLTVLAIISILMIIAIPAYEGYKVRSKLSEGFSLIAGVKVAMADYYLVNGRWPQSNHQAGLPVGTSYSTDYVRSVTILPITVGATVTSQSEVQVAYSIPALGGNDIITFRPSADAGNILWNCRDGGTVAVRFRPRICQ